jgi:hypothetical protein
MTTIIIKELMAKATRQLMTTQALADSAPVIGGVNLGVREDGSPKTVRIPVADYPGLALQCTPTVIASDRTFAFCRSWCFRGANGDGKEIFRGLGSAESVTLAAARKAAERLSAELSSGGKVQGQRAERASLEAQEAPASKSSEVVPQTFSWCAERFIEQAKHRWASRDGSTESFWRSTLTRYVNPVIGNLLVDEVTRAQVLEIIHPLWTAKRATAERVHPMIREVVDWAIAWGHAMERDNPAAWARLEKGLVDQTAKLVKSHVPLHVTRKDGTNDYTPVQEAVAKLRADENVTNLCIEFTLLTGVRMSEPAMRCAMNSIWTPRCGLSRAFA